MEYCEGGNLNQLNLGGEAEKSESEIRKILLDICTALRPLHKKKAVHLHIKPGKIPIELSHINPQYREYIIIKGRKI